MKTLYLLRHAKSDWGTGGSDHDRSLSPRGIDAAKRVGCLLAETGQVPERIVSSSAVRARTTVELAASAGSWPTEIELDRELYDTGPDAVLAWLKRIGEGCNSLLLAGHQPTWSLLAEGLIGGGQLRFPTAALARIDLHVESWAAVDYGCGELVWFQIPRVLKSMGWP